MIRARFDGVTVAEADHTVMLEGNHYIPPDSLSVEHLERTGHHTLCPWKGIVSYYSVVVGDQRYENAAWTYRHPILWARRIKSHVAFGPAVEIEVDSQAEIPDGGRR
jgi:uncharacterized protein (DUF427 family)